MLSSIANYKVDGKATDTIISIDLSSETITTTLCPPSTTSSIGSEFNTPLLYKESLALVSYYNDTFKRGFDIWVVDEFGVKESLKKLFTFGVKV